MRLALVRARMPIAGGVIAMSRRQTSGRGRGGWRSRSSGRPRRARCCRELGGRLPVRWLGGAGGCLGSAKNQRGLFRKEGGGGISLTIQSALSQSCYSRVCRTSSWAPESIAKRGARFPAMLHSSKECAILQLLIHKKNFHYREKVCGNALALCPKSRRGRCGRFGKRLDARWSLASARSRQIAPQ